MVVNSVVVVVECPTCHRPLAKLMMAGGRVTVVGETHAENGDPRGVLTNHAGPRRKWESRVRVYSTDSGLAPGTASGAGRRTFVCEGRKHRSRWVVTEDSLTTGYLKAKRAERAIVSVTELR